MKKVMAVTGLIALGLAGCAVEQQPLTTATTRQAAPTTEPTTQAAAPTASDFAVRLKVTEKQCFGSAGCNVTVKPKISIVGVNLPSEGSVDLTFKVSGDDSGPVIETAELDLAEGTYYSNEIWLSTSSSGITPEAKITDVEYSN